MDDRDRSLSEFGGQPGAASPGAGPGAGEDLARLSLPDRIDVVCDDFERAWKENARPSLAGYLERLPKSARSELLPHLLLLDQEYRQKRGERPSLEDYLRQVPGDSQLVRRLWRDESTVTRWGSEETAGGDASSTRAEPAGKEFGDYRLFEEIGRGGMGVVYRARQKSLNREVAVKLILPGRFAGPAELQRFRLEAEAAANLNHPGVVSIYEIGAQDGQPFFSLELVEGTDLRQLVRDGPMEPRRAAELVRQTAEIIEFSHRQGVVHRDLKPANVLLDKDGKVRVTDFGLAKRSGDDSGLTLSGEVLGTPCYMPPEQAGGRVRDVGPRSDVYSLGAILYCLLTGRPPFEAATVTETLRQVLDSEPVPPRRLNPALPPDLCTVCSKCLEKKTENRYESAAALANDLERFLSDRPITGRPVGAIRRGLRWCRRQPALATILLLLAVMAVLGPAAAVRERALRKRMVRAEQDKVAAFRNELLSADARAVPIILKRWQLVPPELIEQLAVVYHDPQAGERDRLRAALLLASENQEAKRYLQGRLTEVAAEEFPTLRDALLPFRSEIVPRLWQLLAEERSAGSERLRAASALAVYDPRNSRWSTAADDAAHCYVGCNPIEAALWLDALHPSRRVLLAPLARVADDAEFPVDQRLLATRAIAAYAADDPETLAAALLRADARQWQILFPVLSDLREDVLPFLRREIEPNAGARTGDEGPSQTAQDAAAGRRANAAVALVLLGDADEVWPLLARSEDCRLRSYLVHRWRPLGVNPLRLFWQLQRTEDVARRRALLLSLGTFPFAEIRDATGDNATAERVLSVIRDLLRRSPDAGMHAAARYVLNSWGREEEVAALQSELAERGMTDERNWYVHPERLTMVKLSGPITFSMGSPAHEPLRDADETRHPRHMDRSFAIAATEITNRQFDRFLRDHPQLACPEGSKYSPFPDGPRVVVSWLEAAAFCNWLSRRGGLPEDEWCYPSVDEMRSGKPLPEDLLDRTGYRLPTEAEWEYACRAGSVTPRYYGYDESLLERYAWYWGTRETAAPVAQLAPNDFGLFDMHGNVWEWCHDRKRAYPGPREDAQSVPAPSSAGPVTLDEDRVLRGGATDTGPRYIRSADRSWYPTRTQNHAVGFRPARTLNDHARS